MLVEEIYRTVAGGAAESHVGDVRVGLGYTAVALDNGRCGLAYTLHEKEYESCSVVAEAGTLAGRKATELLSWVKSSDQTACAIGLATANALIDVPKEAVESDILDMLPVRSEDVVGMIGYFGPLVGPIRERAQTLHVFERKALPNLGILPDTAAPDLLPSCDIVVLSATTLLNQTIDSLLDLSTKAREIALLGPSTPFLPELFAGKRITMLSGVEVVDTPRLLQVVSEAGGTRHFGRAVRKLNLRVPR